MQAAPIRVHHHFSTGVSKCAGLAKTLSRRCQAGAVHPAQTAAAGSPSLPLQTGNARRSCSAHLIAGKQCLPEQKIIPGVSNCPCVSVQAGDARRELQEAQRAFAQQQGEAHAKLEAELRAALEAARAAAQGSSQQPAWEELREQTERDGRQLREQLQDLEAQVGQVTLPADPCAEFHLERCCMVVEAAAESDRPG